MTTKLHLGCGKCYLPGWHNVDIFSTPKADAYHDVTALPYAPESFEIIYASHLLEHVHRHMVLSVLNHWVALLRPGGTLRLAVPDFAAVCEWYGRGHSIADVMGLLYGGQNYHLNRHTVAFDHASLSGYMTMAGLKDIRVWDWRKTEHAEHDDYSRAYLPNYKDWDKPGSLHVSLNLEGTK